MARKRSQGRLRRTNFGKNVSLRPVHGYTPADEGEVLRILEDHRGRRVRAVGSLHSWSEAVAADDVLLDLRHLDGVTLRREGGQITAVVGAGCRIKRLLRELEGQGGCTLCSQGLITDQTIAGAISTGTHGSGRHSMSHYVQSLRVARYAADGGAVIDEISAGDELRAARCGLGSLGIVLDVTIRCREAYQVEEHFVECASLEEALDGEADHPLQQFYLIPWRFTYFVQRRREVSRGRSKLAPVYRAYWFVTMDVGLHLLVLLIVRVLRSPRLVRGAFRGFVTRLVARGWKVVDRSSAMLVMKHALFRHIEIEVFVPRRHLPVMMEFVRQVLEVAADRRESLSEEHGPAVAAAGMTGELEALRGRYCHHYPICVRRVVPDDTLISASSGGDEDWYAVSFISYASPAARDGFFAFAGFMGRSSARRFGGRPHWGKVCRLEPEELRALYPEFSTFSEVCRRADPDGVFRNEWTDLLLNEQVGDSPPTGPR